jgi:hypothetical protein
VTIAFHITATRVVIGRVLFGPGLTRSSGLPYSIARSAARWCCTSRSAWASSWRSCGASGRCGWGRRSPGAGC